MSLAERDKEQLSFRLKNYNKLILAEHSTTVSGYGTYIYCVLRSLLACVY